MLINILAIPYLLLSLQHLEAWPKNIPVCVHAEERTLAAVLMMANLANQPLHICHVARKEEILLVKAAKAKVRPTSAN